MEMTRELWTSDGGTCLVARENGFTVRLIASGNGPYGKAQRPPCVTQARAEEIATTLISQGRDHQLDGVCFLGPNSHGRHIEARVVNDPAAPECYPAVSCLSAPTQGQEEGTIARGQGDRAC